MSLKLYRLDCECPKCARRPARRVTDAGLRGYHAMHPNEIIESVKCDRMHAGRSCGELFWMRARAWHNAVLVESVEQPAPEFPPALLSPRQAAVCALVVEGRTDARIGREMEISVWTVRDYLERAARVLRVVDPSLRLASPRQTVQAYFAARGDKGLFEQGRAA